MKKWQICAVLAALCNATIGGLSKILFQSGLAPIQVAFYKCFIAFIFISLLQVKVLPTLFRSRKHDWHKIALAALFGVFTLYYFETEAYSYATIATVVFALLASSTITTFLMSNFCLGDSLDRYQFFALVLAILGLLFMIKPAGNGMVSVGGGLAVIAGIGYGLFFTVSKSLKLDTGGLAFLWWFIGFGCIFLAIPFFFTHPNLPRHNSLLGLTLLAIIPTIGGFYFTSNALSQGIARGVQIFELSEPIFAVLIGLLIFHENIGIKDVIGGGLILLAIYCFNMRPISV
jgi:drug/metabolite transporter (DMT)-like permease